MLIKNLLLFLGNNCNGDCKYCFRKFYPANSKETQLTKQFKEWLMENCIKYKRVVFIGGEPLLYFTQIKELCSIIPVFVPKRIVTNGLLLTKDIIEFCNANNIEIGISHDGRLTKELRGYDSLELNKALIPLIDKISIHSTVINRNLDIIDNYCYSKKLVENREFRYVIDIYLNKNNTDEFIKGFDYRLLRKNLVEYTYVFPEQQNGIKQCFDRDENLGSMICLNGDIVNLLTLKKYGTVFDNEDDVFIKIKQDYIKCRNCKDSPYCCTKKQFANEHFCKLARIIREASEYTNEGEI